MHHTIILIMTFCCLSVCSMYAIFDMCLYLAISFSVPCFKHCGLMFLCQTRCLKIKFLHFFHALPLTNAKFQRHKEESTNTVGHILKLSIEPKLFVIGLEPLSMFARDRKQLSSAVRETLSSLPTVNGAMTWMKSTQLCVQTSLKRLVSLAIAALTSL